MSMTPDEIVRNTGSLPTLPHIATKVMRLLGEPNTTAKDLQAVIITDQGMTGQILKISNSALFGLKREVKTLTHAILILGFNTIRSIVMASAGKKLYTEKGATSFEDKLIWENSIGTALIARYLTDLFVGPDKEEAFIGGLMHNLGRTVLKSNFPDKYGELMVSAYNQGEPIHFFERKEFGFDHAELGYCILKQWNLSETLANAVRFYLAPTKAPVESRKITGIISLATKYCLHLGCGYGKPIPLEEQDLKSVMDVLEIDSGQILRWAEVVGEKLGQDSEMMKTL